MSHAPYSRRKKDGDRFRPKWRDRPVKLKDFLRGQGVPLHRRDQVALICDQDDTVRGVRKYTAALHLFFSPDSMVCSAVLKGWQQSEGCLFSTFQVFVVFPLG